MIQLTIRCKLSLITLYFTIGIVSISAAQGFPEFTKAAFVSGVDTMQYRLLYPKNYDKHKCYPLVVFLHGDGERGNDNEKQLYAIPRALTDNIGRIKYPCFILSPQCPNNRLWTSRRV
jgi:predicted peptidase